MNPLVSIIMPAYNSSTTICEAISSVLDQTFQEWELIVIDDNSTDNTVEIISSFSDPRIELISLPSNEGPGYCRDLGLKKASGFYISFLDSDDFWFRNFLNVYVQALQNYAVDLVYGSYIMKKELQSKVFKPKDLCFEQLFVQNPLSCLAVLLTRSANTFSGRPREDLFFWSQVLKNPDLRFYKINKPLAIYHLSKSSRSSHKFSVASSQLSMIFERWEFFFFKKVWIFMKYFYFGVIKYRI